MAPSSFEGLAILLATALCAGAIVFVAANHALDVQIAVAVIGSALLVASVATMTRTWPKRRESLSSSLLWSLGFFLGSVAVFVLLLGVGLFH